MYFLSVILWYTEPCILSDNIRGRSLVKRNIFKFTLHLICNLLHHVIFVDGCDLGDVAKIVLGVVLCFLVEGIPCGCAVLVNP